MNDSPTIHPGSIAQARALRDDLHWQTETDTLNRARWRVNVTFAAFYDDEPTEPDQAIRDALTDLLHEAEARGVDFAEAVERARHMYDQERAEWAEWSARGAKESDR